MGKGIGLKGKASYRGVGKDIRVKGNPSYKGMGKSVKCFFFDYEICTLQKDSKGLYYSF